MGSCKLDIFNAFLAASSKAEQEHDVQPGPHTLGEKPLKRSIIFLYTGDFWRICPL